MGELGLRGAVRGKVRATISDKTAAKPADLGARNFTPLAPDTLWVADLTYVSTWSGWCYTAFVIDAYARRILGWSVATTMTTQLVLDAIDQAIWTRHREGRDLTGLIAHHDHGGQYLSLAHSERLEAAGITPSVGAVGSSYDNALADSLLAHAHGCPCVGLPMSGWAGGPVTTGLELILGLSHPLGRFDETPGSHSPPGGYLSWQ